MESSKEAMIRMMRHLSWPSPRRFIRRWVWNKYKKWFARYYWGGPTGDEPERLTCIDSISVTLESRKTIMPKTVGDNTNWNKRLT